MCSTYLIRRLGFEYLEEQIEGSLPYVRGEINPVYSVSIHQADGFDASTPLDTSPSGFSVSRKERNALAKNQQMVVFAMAESTAEILSFPFLDGRIYAFSLFESSIFCAAGSCFFKYDIPSRVHILYTLKSPLPTRCECVGIYCLKDTYLVLFKSLTTRHIELWNFLEGTCLIAFDSENEENLIYTSVREPGFLVAYSSKNVYVWDLREEISAVSMKVVKVTVKTPLSAVAFGDGHLVGGDFNGNLRVFDTLGGTPIFDFDFGKVFLAFILIDCLTSSFLFIDNLVAKIKFH